MAKYFEEIESVLKKLMVEICKENPDPSHDILHIERVVRAAKKLSELENADLNIVVPAAYLHDCEVIEKSDPQRSQVSSLSAKKALGILKELKYPEKYFDGIAHAIAAHSFSSGIVAETIEAKVLQDADRLDGLGAIGVARCFSLGGKLNRPFYSDEDPYAESRTPDDNTNNLDHFFVKLLKVANKLQTPAAKEDGRKRTEFLKAFLTQLRSEIL
ncbi:MAG: hypothetical protein COV44_09650 [Deltaproteobacteria bacterium CG11_big_fil_rev_8_21_14_0_20_45_16]|nr:MAG: hypothetical protein COV44_09650 [Deltaproteobacteria bacterium CG11_big_fil_rev_8_21_14_0_20_45_16]